MDEIKRRTIAGLIVVSGQDPKDRNKFDRRSGIVDVDDRLAARWRMMLRSSIEELVQHQEPDRRRCPGTVKPLAMIVSAALFAETPRGTAMLRLDGDLAFWCEYFKIAKRHEVDYLIRYYEAMALMHPALTPLLRRAIIRTRRLRNQIRGTLNSPLR